MRNAWLLMSCLFFAVPLASFGKMLEMQGTAYKKMSAAGVEVPLHKKAKLKIPGTEQEVELFLTGAGIRSKRVGPVNAKVYIATHYLDTADVMSSSAPMDSVKAAAHKVIQLTTLRALTAAQINEAFKESLVANGFNPEEPVWKNLFEKITFDVDKNAKITLAGVNAGLPSQTIFIEHPQGEDSQTNDDFADQLWTMWFGIPVDNDMANLKRALTVLP